MIRTRHLSFHLQFFVTVAAVVVALLSLGGAYYAYGRVIEERGERAILRDQATQTASAVAARARAGAGLGYFRQVQEALGNDQLIVFRGGRQVFAGPLGREVVDATATSRFPGGRVVVVANALEDPWISSHLTLVAGGLVGLVLIAALLYAARLARLIREALDRAISAADHIASGDLEARMGTAGPEEFARLGRAFDGMAARLQSVDQDQRRFLADLAHEIATPLSSISGFASALQDGSAVTPTQTREATAMISAGAARLDSLLTDLRRLSNLDLLESPRPERIDLRPFCEDLTAQLQPLASSAGVSLCVHGDAVHVTSDRCLLENVVRNFLTNAIRYTPRGGTVETSVVRWDGHIIVSVKDTGIGIPVEDRGRIFDRFYRVDDARARETGGSGLGLAIAQRSALALAGRIEVDSQPDAGSEFRLLLPAASAIDDEPDPIDSITAELLV